MGYKPSWKCHFSGEDIKIGDRVELAIPGCYEGFLTAGKTYPV